jgi:SpoVK/Ycf46/Vps4 family AAA+-type ATPase
MYIGESERKLHALFERAREKTPAVLFFDELEALAGKRQYSREGTAAKLVSQFLAEMDGFTKNNQGVLIIGATNVPWAIDPAFRRPGRFDRVVFIPPPDQAARASILELLLSGRPLDPALDVGALARKLAAKTGGYSGADLEGLVETAADVAIERSLAASREEPIDEGTLFEALKTAKPTTLEWLTTARNHARFANEGGQYDDVLEFLRAHGKA